MGSLYNLKMKRKYNAWHVQKVRGNKKSKAKAKAKAKGQKVLYAFSALSLVFNAQLQKAVSPIFLIQIE